MTLKEILTEYRKMAKISQREFAKKCGLSNSLISILEMGINPQTGKEMSPDMDTYKKLADGMGMTLQALFLEIGESGYVNIGSQISYDDSLLLNSYHAADPGIQRSVRILLGIEKEISVSEQSAI